MANEEQAQIVANTIGVDKEFSDGDIKRDISSDGSYFVARFSTTKKHVKILRTAISSLSTNLKLVIGTVKEFSP